MAKKYTPNSRALQKLLVSNAMYKALEPVAEAIADNARSIAPIDSGQYRDSITTEHALTDRAVIRVVADVDYGLAIEARDGTLGIALEMES